MEFPFPDQHVLPDQIRIYLPPLPSSSSSGRQVDQFIGSILGLATGDALGARVEFRPHEYLIDNPVRDMKGGGTWGLQPGQWTDDTSMALCLASSLISQHGYNPYDQMVRYKWWYKYGYMSSTGHCFDIGNATRDSLDEFSRRQQSLINHLHCKKDEVDYLKWNKIQNDIDVNCSSSGVAGNGALMRLAPVPLFFYKYPEIAVEYAGKSALLTHGDRKAADACRYYAALIVAAVNNRSKKEILSNDFYETNKSWFGSNELHPEILAIAHGSYKKSNGYDDGVRGKGYIVKALEAALWAFWSDEDSFKTGALNAVNLGDDTDTTAAIYGQLAGAYYGYRQLPEHWLKQIYARKLLECIGQWLYYEGTQFDPSVKTQVITSPKQTSMTTIVSNKQHPIVPQTFTSNAILISPEIHHTTGEDTRKSRSNNITSPVDERDNYRLILYQQKYDHPSVRPSSSGPSRRYPLATVESHNYPQNSDYSSNYQSHRPQSSHRHSHHPMSPSHFQPQQMRKSMISSRDNYSDSAYRTSYSEYSNYTPNHHESSRCRTNIYSAGVSPPYINESEVLQNDERYSTTNRRTQDSAATYKINQTLPRTNRSTYDYSPKQTEIHASRNNQYYGSGIGSNGISDKYSHNLSTHTTLPNYSDSRVIDYTDDRQLVPNFSRTSTEYSKSRHIYTQNKKSHWK